MKKAIKYTLITLVCLIIISAFLPNKSVLAAETSGVTDGMLYNIVNKASGKNLNVNLGTDANGTNVIQWSNDGSQEQKFRVVYYDTMGSTSVDAYKIYAMCSAKGSNRVVDVLRAGGVSTGAIQSGGNVDIWTTSINKVDYDCQLFKIQSEGSGYYSIRLRYNTSLALTSIGTANGSGAGNTSTATGNVIIQTFSSGNANQLWKFMEIVGTPASPYKNTRGISNRTYYIDSTASTYSDFIRDGSAKWNSTIKLTRSYDFATTDVDFYATGSAYFGNTTYAAVTFTLSPTGDYVEPNSDGNWTFVKILINDLIFPSKTASDDDRRSCIAHEIGHAYGLKHTNSMSSIMYPDNTGGAISPGTADYAGITYKY